MAGAPALVFRIASNPRQKAMPNHQVFLIHGMGNFAPNWAGPIKAAIRQTFNAYPRVAALGLADRFDFVEVTYNDVFDKWRKLWRDDAQSAAAAATALNLDSSAANQLVSLARSASGNSFFQTHVLDVALYRYLRQFSEEVDQSVRTQILERLNTFPAGQLPPWSAIAHSLGSAVLHNSLQAMFTQRVGGVALGDAYMPVNLFMVANVGKVLWNKGGDFYMSKVRPHGAQAVGFCTRYANFDHALDPFTHVDPFDPPPEWFPPDLARAQVFSQVSIARDDVQQLNVHGLSHYWSHPEVHVGIIRGLLDIPGVISNTERDAALAAWRAHRLANQAGAAAQARLMALLARQLQPWGQVVERLFDFRDAVLDAGLDPRDGET